MNCSKVDQSRGMMPWSTMMSFSFDRRVMSQSSVKEVGLSLATTASGILVQVRRVSFMA